MVLVEGEAYRVRHVNAAFLRLVGAQRSDLMGVSFAEALPESKTNGCASLLDRVFHTGIPESLAEQKHGMSPPAFWSYDGWPILGHDEKPLARCFR